MSLWFTKLNERKYSRQLLQLPGAHIRAQKTVLDIRSVLSDRDVHIHNAGLSA